MIFAIWNWRKIPREPQFGTILKVLVFSLLLHCIWFMDFRIEPKKKHKSMMNLVYRMLIISCACNDSNYDRKRERKRSVIIFVHLLNVTHKKHSFVMCHFCIYTFRYSDITCMRYTKLLTYSFMQNTGFLSDQSIHACDSFV